jgi:hypothetical protein
MPYKTSRARRNLQRVYSEIRGRLRTAQSPDVEPAIREYVIAAAIFLAHAEIENYVADLFSAFAAGVHAKGVKGSNLPGRLQSHLFLAKANARTAFASVLGGSSEKQLLDAFTIALRGPPGTVVNDAVVMTLFSGEEICGKLRYPSSDNLKKLFSRVGVDNVFGRLSALLKQDAEALLQSLGSLRTQLAHTGTLPGVSSRDVRDRIRGAEHLVGAIDRLMFKVTSAHFGSAVWSSHVC